MINNFKNFGIFVECASNSVPNVKTLKEFIDIISQMGYNRLYLGTADTYEIKSEPYFGYMRGRYVKSEIRELDNYAIEKGITLVPAIQVLGHLPFLYKYEGYDQLIDNGNVLLVGDEKVNVLIDKMFAAMADYYTAREIHIGMDEAFGIGLGKYLEINGLEQGINIMLKHLQTVLKIAEKYGFICEMWSDMFFRLCNSGKYDDEDCDIPEDIKNKVPDNLKLVYWNYRKTEAKDFDVNINRHKKISRNLAFAGGVVKWQGFAPDNAYSIDMCASHIDGCLRNDIDSFIITLWADCGSEASLFSVLPGLYYYAQYAKGKAKDLTTLNKKGFKEIVGVDFDDFMKLDLLNKPHGTVTDVNCKNLFYLYGDILFGDYDSLMSSGLNEAYKKVADKLRKVIGGKFQYIFDNLIYLADVLSIKAELSKRLRVAYINKDFKELSLIIDDIQLIVKKLDKFFQSTKIRWYNENKSFGFEVLCIRIGALRQRMLFVADLLSDYIQGKILQIEELEVEHLPFNLRASKKPVTEDNYTNITWSLMVTHGFL